MSDGRINLDAQVGRWLMMATGWSSLGGGIFLIAGFKEWFGVAIIVMAILMILLGVSGRYIRGGSYPAWHALPMAIAVLAVALAPCALLPFMRDDVQTLIRVMYFTATVGFILLALIDFVRFRPKVR